MKKYLFVIFCLLFTATATVNSAPVEEVKGRQYPISMTVISGGDYSGQPVRMVEVSTGDYLKVVLHAAGGTGYSWELSEENFILVEVVDKTAGPVNKFLHLPGDQVEWVFYLKAAAAGQESLRFYLNRYGEENKKAARVFSLTVIAK